MVFRDSWFHFNNPIKSCYRILGEFMTDFTLKQYSQYSTTVLSKCPLEKFSIMRQILLEHVKTTILVKTFLEMFYLCEVVLQNVSPCHKADTATVPGNAVWLTVPSRDGTGVQPLRHNGCVYLVTWVRLLLGITGKFQSRTKTMEMLSVCTIDRIMSLLYKTQRTFRTNRTIAVRM